MRFRVQFIHKCTKTNNRNPFGNVGIFISCVMEVLLKKNSCLLPMWQAYFKPIHSPITLTIALNVYKLLHALHCHVVDILNILYFSKRDGTNAKEVALMAGSGADAHFQLFEFSLPTVRFFVWYFRLNVRFLLFIR